MGHKMQPIMVSHRPEFIDEDNFNCTSVTRLIFISGLIHTTDIVRLFFPMLLSGDRNGYR